ncbi:fluoride efflux transporter CrcB [Tumebacillus permanentifrigoris]|uniref:Fluoride-specific ion channel FluC n=1 Tax=Tumebacillus permanentifrigoris TaxID=378543 RepID=A0A316D3V6_9BACL|nr:fluoride efflux transporter CrcB [Tumebacillus permanentifrigoris]PWK05986.1 camphor resistance protein CrcB [Tumebacillus permanentifrigoris]
MEFLWVLLGGCIGAPLRFGVGRFVSKKWQGAFPLGTFLINIIGSFCLGLLYGAQTSQSVWLLLGTGVLGAFTTFSTFGVETVGLLEKKRVALALSYVLLSALVGILGAYLGQAWYTGRT